MIYVNSIEIGKFIAELRKERKLTQNDLADLLRVTNKAVSRWETGEGFPDIVILPKLAEVLNVSVDEILKGQKIGINDLRKGKPQLKLTNVYIMSQTIIFASFILFLTLTYTTFKVWIGMIGYFIPVLLALVWFLIEKNRFIFDSEYTNDDRLFIKKCLTRILKLFSVLTSMVLVQFIIEAENGNFSNSAANFEYYALVGSLVGLGVFIVTTLLFRFYPDIMNFSQFIKRLGVGFYAFFAIIFCLLVLDFWHEYDMILLIGLVYVTSIGYSIIKNRKPLYLILIPLLPFLVLLLLLIPFASESSAIITGIYVWELILSIASIYFWIKRYKHKKFDVIYWSSYQNLSLVFSLAVFIFYNQILNPNVDQYYSNVVWFNIGVLCILTMIHFITNRELYIQKELSHHDMSMK